jgi:hypothetical protein
LDGQTARCSISGYVRASRAAGRTARPRGRTAPRARGLQTSSRLRAHLRAGRQAPRLGCWRVLRCSRQGAPACVRCVPPAARERHRAPLHHRAATRDALQATQGHVSSPGGAPEPSSTRRMCTDRAVERPADPEPHGERAPDATRVSPRDACASRSKLRRRTPPAGRQLTSADGARVRLRIVAATSTATRPRIAPRVAVPWSNWGCRRHVVVEHPRSVRARRPVDAVARVRSSARLTASCVCETTHRLAARLVVSAQARWRLTTSSSQQIAARERWWRARRPSGTSVTWHDARRRTEKACTRARGAGQAEGACGERRASCGAWRSRVTRQRRRRRRRATLTAAASAPLVTAQEAQSAAAAVDLPSADVAEAARVSAYSHHGGRRPRARRNGERQSSSSRMQHATEQHPVA